MQQLFAVAKKKSCKNCLAPQLTNTVGRSAARSGPEIIPGNKLWPHIFHTTKMDTGMARIELPRCIA
eukprot:1138616-Pelagomonas_calceolata.AAC.5